ncbi:MAG: hypothetical protein NTY26_17090 [Burkholderiales bacterium]|nr:hypothetical protein [Burkholderiales bacterium]
MLGALCAADAAVRGVDNAVPQDWLQRVVTVPAASADLNRLGC